MPEIPQSIAHLNQELEAARAALAQAPNPGEHHRIAQLAAQKIPHAAWQAAQAGYGASVAQQLQFELGQAQSTGNDAWAGLMNTALHALTPQPGPATGLAPDPVQPSYTPTGFTPGGSETKKSRLMWPLIAGITVVALIGTSVAVFALRDRSPDQASVPTSSSAAPEQAAESTQPSEPEPTEEPIPLDPGVVRAWGKNNSGQLGNGDTKKQKSAVVVQGLTNVQSVTPVGRATFAVLMDGTVYSWGLNESGQLGDGTTADRPVPTQIDGLTDVKQVVGAWDSVLALHNDGTVSAWGKNKDGELGNKTTEANPIPTKIEGLNNIASLLATGQAAILALLQDGTVMAWGSNITGQLGDGTTNHRPQPLPIEGLQDVRTLSANGGGVYAVLHNGTVMSWGDLDDGALGDRGGANALYPAKINGLDNVSAVIPGHNTAYAIMQDGTIKSWGSNKSGLLGNGSDNERSDSPVTVTGVDSVQAISIARSATYALLTDGTVMAWGSNSQGHLGDGTTDKHTAPIPIAGLTGVMEIYSDWGSPYALLQDGKIMVWGDKEDGLIGDAATGEISLPVPFGDIENGVALFGDVNTYFVILSEG